MNLPIQTLKVLKYSHLRKLENLLEEQQTCKHCFDPINNYCPNQHKKNSVEVTDTDILIRSVECQHYQNAKTQKILNTAGVPKIFQNISAQKDFQITKGNLQAAQTANESVLNNQGVYLYGACGVGKTMLASIIANERAKRNKQSLFITVTDLFYELNPYHYTNEEKHKLPQKRQLLRQNPCLIIDDLGAEKSSQWTNQTLFDIIDYRYKQNLQTIITSNFSPSQLSKRLTDYEGDRIIRRINAICTPILMKYLD